ncbi:CLUMA_CG000546, isoform A [Clunio marinus]|uniref:CLUMA_CG000546, isoform A n=1 Tax=Clunio marinus TaxID=568069 RepID=A0A1J1HKE6_9DIPT|nr:CLUMA_CG000546, isoform A [Clunio marinus]
MKINYEKTVKSVEAFDIRFPTSLSGDGSDAIHSDPDYSVCYVIIRTNDDLKGHGMTFTLGKGTNIVLNAVENLKFLVENQSLNEIYKNFGLFWRKLTSESQLRWLGPEKGVMHLAVAAIVNALWDLWGKLEGKPVWKLLTDMEPEFVVTLLDFRYCTDVLTKDEAIQLLKKGSEGKTQRVEELLETGYRAYTTATGWLGYSDEKMIELCQKYMKKGFDAFKIKIGQDLKRDIERCKLMRNQIGYDRTFMLDSNQIFDVDQAIDWVIKLKDFKPLWIEEPTSPDDILGHAKIADALRPFNIGVASGEMIANRVVFKQFFQANAFEFCQVDSARIGGVNEILLVYLMAKKFNKKVCPHAGGVGLSEMVQHLQFWDYTSVSGSKEGRYIEFVDQQHDQFVNPAIVQNACYIANLSSGYNTELKAECVEKFQYPMGSEWQKLLKTNLYANSSM